MKIKFPGRMSLANMNYQGFSQVLRTWGRELLKIWEGGGGGGLKSKHESLKCCQKIPVKEFI